MLQRRAEIEETALRVDRGSDTGEACEAAFARGQYWGPFLPSPEALAKETLAKDELAAVTSATNSSRPGVPTIADGAPPAHLYLTSFSYTVSNPNLMWTVEDFIVEDEVTGQERPWHNLLVVTGNDTAFAELSRNILLRTNVSVPLLWNFDQSNWQGTVCRVLVYSAVYRTVCGAGV
jgi:hypothetical protein